MDRRVIADTDVLADFLNAAGAGPAVRGYLRARRLATSSVTAFELWRGATTDQDRSDVRSVLQAMRLYALDERGARKAAEVWQALKERGENIGERDTLIAGICLAVGLPLLTRNVKHFRRVRGLRLAELTEAR